MPHPKRKSTHFKPAIPVNSKKRGKVETNKLYLTENSKEVIQSHIQSSTSTSNSDVPTFTVSNLDIDTTQSHIQPSTSTLNCDVPTPTVPNSDTNSSTKPQSNIYYERKQKEVGAWENLRPVAVDGLLEGHAPISRKCIICREYSDAPIRCKQCSTTYIACGICALKDHEIRPFHSLEIWQVRG